ncbi:MAG: ABC transporter substrate-binding protein [Tissierellia bacterium]|nr:ABC transporter substrate-binding protein [Tissierellia bacterium]
MKKIIQVLSLLVLSLSLVACKDQEESGSLHVFNWGDYMDPDTIAMFEEETGVKVVYDTFASNEDLYVKIKQGSDPYDVIVPSEYMLERMITEDLLQPLDYDRIPNMSKLDPRLLDKPYDPGNTYSVPYFWGTLGMVVNRSIIEDEIDSWDALWNEDYKGQIIMYNSQRDSLAVALARLGYSMNSQNMEELEEAKASLFQQKHLVYAYLADEVRDVMVQGEAGICVMYSGDALAMMEENEDLDYIIPKEGTNLWYDSFTVPKNAKNPQLAMDFINFMCRPDIAAKNAEYCTGYSSPIPEAIALLPKEISQSPVSYPDLKDLPRLEVYIDLGEWTEVYDRIWTEVTAY